MATVGAMPFVRVEFFVPLYLVATLAWLGFVWWARAACSYPKVIAIAFLVRMALLLGEPGLSPDFYRYRWDGRVSAAGINPYRYSPNDPALSFLGDAQSQRVEHGEIRSVYPPWAQFLFLGFSGNLLTWRFMILAFELAAVFLLRHSRAALAYACCPLVLIEGVWSGHLDAIAAVLLLGAVILAPKRALLAGSLLGLAAGIKLLPLAAAPALGRRGGIRFVAAFLAVLLLPALLFAPLMSGLGDYATRWSFNSPIYELTRASIEITSLDLLLKSVFTTIKDPLRLEAVSKFVYRQLHAEMIARGFLAIAWIAGVLVIMKRGDAVLSSTGLLILCSPTIHPWYWLIILPLALRARSGFWLSLALASPISYLWYLDGVPKALIYAGCYGPAVAVLAGQTISGLRERDIRRWTALPGDSPS